MADEHTVWVNRLIQSDYKDPSVRATKPAQAVNVDALGADAGKVQATLDSEGWQIIQKLLGRVHEQHMRKMLTDASTGTILDQSEYASRLAYASGIKQSQIAAESFQIALQVSQRALNAPVRG